MLFRLVLFFTLLISTVYANPSSQERNVLLSANAYSVYDPLSEEEILHQNSDFSINVEDVNNILTGVYDNEDESRFLFIGDYHGSFNKG